MSKNCLARLAKAAKLSLVGQRTNGWRARQKISWSDFGCWWTASGGMCSAPFLIFLHSSFQHVVLVVLVLDLVVVVVVVAAAVLVVGVDPASPGAPG